MKIAKNKKGNSLLYGLGAIFIVMVIAGIWSFGLNQTGDSQGLAITRFSGDYVGVDAPYTLSPAVEEGTPFQVEYSAYFHGRQRTWCGFIELLVDDDVQESVFFCSTNSNHAGKDATELRRNVTISGVSEGIHTLSVRYSMTSRSPDVDDEHLYKLRDCPDGDREADGDKIEEYMGSAFPSYVKYMPCEYKGPFPRTRDEYVYPTSLIDYALTVDNDFSYDEKSRTIYVAEDGTYDEFREQEQLEAEIAYVQSKIAEVEAELKRTDITLTDELRLAEELEKWQDALDDLLDDAPASVVADNDTGSESDGSDWWVTVKSWFI